MGDAMQSCLRSKWGQRHRPCRQPTSMTQAHAQRAGPLWVHACMQHAHVCVRKGARPRLKVRPRQRLARLQLALQGFQLQPGALQLPSFLVVLDVLRAHGRHGLQHLPALCLQLAQLVSCYGQLPLQLLHLRDVGRRGVGHGEGSAAPGASPGRGGAQKCGVQPGGRSGLTAHLALVVCAQLILLRALHVQLALQLRDVSGDVVEGAGLNVKLAEHPLQRVRVRQWPIPCLSVPWRRIVARGRR